MPRATLTLAFLLGCGHASSGSDTPGGATPTAPCDTTDGDNDGYAGCDDCDDTDWLIFPGAEETCDDVDNDCNGVVDDLVVTWYADSDGDGYGDSEDAVVGDCNAVSGRVIEADDCDDTDATLHPYAEDVCEDGVDQDCTGADHLCGRYGLGDADRVVSAFGTDSAYLGLTTDPQGGEQPVVGALFHGLECCDEKTFIQMDAPRKDTHDASLTFVALDREPYLGNCWVIPDRGGDELPDLACGDGFSELLPDSTGLVYLVESPFEGVVPIGAGSTWSGSHAHATLGLSITLAPAAFSDGASAWVLGEDAFQELPDAWLFMGTDAPADVVARDVARAVIEDDAGLRYLAETDIDGDADGYSDLVFWSAQEEGGVTVVRGPVPDGLSNSSELEATTWTGEEARDELLGSFVGDITGDGEEDLLLANYYDYSSETYMCGEFYLVDGTSRGGVAADEALAHIVAWPASGGCYDPASFHRAGDIDQDGFADLAVSVPEVDSALDDRGAVVVYRGPLSGSFRLDVPTTELSILGNAGELIHGAAAEDINGDGWIDLCASSWGGGAYDEGAYSCFFGPFDFAR